MVGDTSSTGVLYFNIKDTLVKLIVGSTYSVNVDIDNDNTYDISFLHSYSFGPSHYIQNKYVNSLANVQFAYGSNNQYADTIPPGVYINNGLNWQANSITLFSVAQFPPPPYGTGYSEYGQFNTGSKYLGFRKIFTSDTVYGWINLEMPNYIIKSYAYEKKCNVIQCVGIKELYSENFQIFPIPASEGIQIIGDEGKLVNSKITLNDAIGKKLMEIEYRKKLNLSFLENGIYFLQIHLSDKTVIRKILIQH